MMKRETKILNCIEVLFIGINKKKGKRKKKFRVKKKSVQYLAKRCGVEKSGGVMKLWTPHETIEIKVRWDIVLCMFCVLHISTIVQEKKHLRQTIGKGVLTQIKCDEFGQGI